MYAAFDHIDCVTQTSMNQDYQNRQEKLSNHNIDAVSTYRRCFKQTDLEQKMRLDQYETRTYQRWDCNYADEKNAQLDANCKFGFQGPDMCKGINFNQSTKANVPYTQCQYRDMMNSMNCQDFPYYNGPNAIVKK